MPSAEQLAEEKAREKQQLEKGLEKDTELFSKHRKENAEVLSDRKHPDHYFAQSKAAVVANRISQNLKKLALLKTRGTGLVERMAANYAVLAKKHEEKALLEKPKGLASIDYQERAKVVEGNREIYDQKILRNRALLEVADLKGRIPLSGKVNPHDMAKLHNGIEKRLLDAASYTDFLKDGGKGQVPTTEELIREAKFHGKKNGDYTKRILEEKQEQKRRMQVRRTA
jgi:hypothetical protein